MHEFLVTWRSWCKTTKAEIRVMTQTDSTEEALLSAESLFLLSARNADARALIQEGNFTVQRITGVHNAE